MLNFACNRYSLHAIENQKNILLSLLIKDAQCRKDPIIEMAGLSRFVQPSCWTFYLNKLQYCIIVANSREEKNQKEVGVPWHYHNQCNVCNVVFRVAVYRVAECLQNYLV